MKKNFKSVLAVMLVLCMGFTSLLTPVYASYGSQPEEVSAETKLAFGKFVIKAFGKVADALITSVAAMFPDLGWPDADEVSHEGFYEGRTLVQTAPAKSACWYAGYASASIVPDDIEEVGYVRAGEFHFKEERTYSVIEGDDQRFSVVALDDNSSGGKVLFCSMDAFGISSTNVRKLRAGIMAAAKESGINDIASINVTVSHCHSCIDTHGLGASILDLIGESIKAGFFKAIGKEYKVSSVEPEYLEFLIDVASKTAVKAYKSMQPGTLSFASYDINDLLHDKQMPLVYDTNVNQIKFTPYLDSARQIWLVNMGCHPVRMTSSDYVSSDYPGAIVRWADELCNADVAFYQGSQLAITRDESPIKYDSSDVEGLDDTHKTFYVVDQYGKELVTRMKTGVPVESFEIEPYLNIRHAEVSFKVSNSLIMLISKINMANNLVYQDGFGIRSAKVLSEVGYCEFGSRLAIALVPGELEPAIAFGGVPTAAESWNGTDWEYDSFDEMTGDRKLIVFGLTNDQVGYIVPDNDYAHAFASLFEDLIGGSRYKHYEEMISLGNTTASSLAEAFKKLVESTKK